MKQEKTSGLSISVKSFISAILIIFVLMLITYGLTFLIPGGSLPFWKFILSPVLVLGAEGNATLIAVIAFLLVIGGIFNCLTECGLMNYMLNKLVNKFAAVRYRLMAIMILFFMAMGSLIGSFEEVIPMTPIVVALSIGLGWDAVTGLGMSLLAVGCGFAAGIANPFTIGIAQGIAGLPMFSGLWFRALSFCLIYALLLLFLRSHAKKIEKPVQELPKQEDFTEDAALNRGLRLFAILLGIGILLVLSSGFLTFLQDFTLIIVAVMFLAAGLASVTAAGLRGKALLKCFLRGVKEIAPSVLMILMASSIKYILVEAGILDSILAWATGAAGTLPKAGIILFIYLICLVMNFFIPSGSAKAILLIPLIVPIANAFGLSAQLCIVAFAFGDGFSNVFYPTNPGLLVSLGLSDISYGSWARYSALFQLFNLILTSALLLFGLAIGY